MNQLNDVISFRPRARSPFLRTMLSYVTYSKDEMIHIILSLSLSLLVILARYFHHRCMRLQRCEMISEIIRQPNVFHISATQRGIHEINEARGLNDLRKSIVPLVIISKLHRS
jgi:hypothetical protein